MHSKLRSLVPWAISLVLVFVSIEAAAQLAYRLSKGQWYRVDRNSSPRGMVQPHPYFGACLVPNISVERNGVRITHNSFRTRGPEFQRPKPAGINRIVCLGGSSTYCTGVSDDQTWETYLQQQLGPKAEVINFSNAGGTSLENSLHTALLFSDVQPDIALYYLGWNDARVQHVAGLWPDWSDSHGRQVMSIAMSGRDLNERFASTYFLKRTLFHYFFPGMDSDKVLRNLKGDADALTDKIDQRAMGHYVRNVKNIIALCRAQNVTPIFVPQVMNWEVLTNDAPYGWLPFVRDKHLKTVIGAYNDTLEKVAKEQGVEFVRPAMDAKFEPKDFLDQGHFSPEGNQKFARILADYFANRKKAGLTTQVSNVP